MMEIFANGTKAQLMDLGLSSTEAHLVLLSAKDYYLKKTNDTIMKPNWIAGHIPGSKSDVDYWFALNVDCQYFFSYAVS